MGSRDAVTSHTLTFGLLVKLKRVYILQGALKQLLVYASLRNNGDPLSKFSSVLKIGTYALNDHLHCAHKCKVD